MSPLRKYMGQNPQGYSRPVETLLSACLWLAALGLVVSVIHLCIQ